MLFGWKKTRRFTYSIPSLSIFHTDINIKTRECKTLNDLKKIIASNHDISEDDLHFENASDKKLKKFKENYDFKLIFLCSHPDINLLIPGGKIVFIKDSYKMRFEEIFKYIEKEGHYYTPILIQNHILLYLNQRQISTLGFPFSTCKYFSRYELKFNTETVNFQYGDFFFTSSENEKTDNTINLIQKAYPNLNVSIFDSKGNKPDKVNRIEKYLIRVEKIVKFIDINNLDSCKFVNVDYYEKVDQVQKSLAKQLDEPDYERVIICDLDRNAIPKSDKPLRLIKTLDYDFYYRIASLKSMRPKKSMRPTYVRHGKSILSESSESSSSSYYGYDSEEEEAFEDTKMRSYSYSIPELSISSDIRVDVDEIRTVFDLKRQISLDNNIPDSNLKVKDSSAETVLRKIKAYTSFEFVVECSFNDVTLLLPNKQKAVIKNGYKIQFNDIYPHIEKNGFYYSKKCIQNNFKLFLKYKEIPIDGYPFLVNTRNSIFELKLANNPIEIKCYKYTFTFSAGETFTEVRGFVRKVIPDMFIKIVDSKGSYFKCLHAKENYTIRAKKTIKFCDIEGDETNSLSVRIDVFDTISNAKEKLIEKHSTSSGHKKIKNVYIYDGNRKMVTNLDMLFINVQDLEKCFYYKAELSLSSESDSDDSESYSVAKPYSPAKPLTPLRPSAPPKPASPSKPASRLVPLIPLKPSSPPKPKSEPKPPTPFKKVPKKPVNKKLMDLIRPVEDKSDSRDEEYLDIILVCCKSNEKQFYPIRMKVSSKKKISELIKMISEEKKIDDKIVLKNNKMQKLLPTQTIEQVKEKITENNGNVKKKFILYVDIQSKDEEPLEKERIPKAKKDDDIKVEDDDTMVKDDAVKVKKNVPKVKNYIPKVRNDVPKDKDDGLKDKGDDDIKVEDDDTIVKDDAIKVKKNVPKVKNFIPKIRNDVPKDKYDDTKDKKSLKIESTDISTCDFAKPAKKLPKRRSAFKPAITHIPTSEKSTTIKKTVLKTSLYRFEFEEEEREIELFDELTLGNQEETIRNEFDVCPSLQILFKFVSDDEKTVQTDVIDKKVISFKKGTVHMEADKKAKPMLIIDESYISDLKIIKEIKSDECGRVCEVCSNRGSEKKYVLKVMSKINMKNMQNFIKEHEMLHRFDHPHILETFGIFMGTQTKPPSILYEHYNSNLEQLFKKQKLTKASIFKIAYQMAEAMRYVHFNEITHRNLNPKSIVIDDNGKVKLGEFGISKEISLEEQLNLSSKNILGDMKYVAPELINDEKYTQKVDVYSFGILMIFLLNKGSLPFSELIVDLRKKIPKDFTEYAEELIERCISIDPGERPNFDLICNELKENYSLLMDLNDDEDEKIKKMISHINTKIPKYE